MSTGGPATFIRGALLTAVLLPAIFLLHDGYLGGFAWVTTGLLVLLCLLIALGLYVNPGETTSSRPPRPPTWIERLASVWLVACFFGGVLGWALIQVPLTKASWRWIYAGRILLAVVLPLVTGVAAARTRRRVNDAIEITLLVGLTALPVISAWWTLRDLADGPTGAALFHTGRVISNALHLGIAK